MREFRLTIQDTDGEEHLYDFFAGYPLEITEYVLGIMRRKGDFYGHEHLKTMNIDVSELVSGTLGADAMDLNVQGLG